MRNQIAMLLIPFLLSSCGLVIKESPTPPPAPIPTTDPAKNLVNALAWAIDAGEALVPRLAKLTPEQAATIRTGVAAIGKAAVITATEMASQHGIREKVLAIVDAWGAAAPEPAFIGSLPEETARYVRTVRDAIALILTTVTAILGSGTAESVAAAPTPIPAGQWKQIEKRGQKLAKVK